jgi:subtilisin family serine protease
MKAVKVLCFAILVQFLAVSAHAGANAGGRVWVSWDRGGLVTDLNVVQFDQQDFYVHIDGAPDVAALGLQVMFNVAGDSTIALTAAEPDSQVGWAMPAEANAAFLGDSTYNWTIQFPTGHERTKIRYTVSSPLEGDTLRGTIWVQNALVQDSQGQVDTLAICAQARITGVAGPQFSVPTDSLPGLAIVEFAPGTVVGGHQFIFPGDIANEQVRDSLTSVAGFSVAKRVFPSAPDGETARISLSGDTVECRDLSRMYVVKISDIAPVATHLNCLGGLSGVENVQPVAALIAHRIPNDPRYAEQWHLAGSGAAAVGAPQAWDETTGSTGLMVAILDSGIDYHHPEVDPNQDQSRFIRGHDYGDSDDDVFDDTPPDDRGHGTSVGGLIGALTDNSTGVAGVMWQGKVLVHKTADQVGTCPEACFSYHPSYAVAAAIDDAVRRGARVINMSLGYPFAVPSIYDILFKAWWDVAHGDPIAVASYTAYRLGATLVASAGNDGHNWVDKPAAFPWVLSVGASDVSGNRASFSNYGARLDFLAPGENTLTLAMMDQSGGYVGFSGTSASAPITTGSAALLVAESGARSLDLSNEDIMNLLKFGCRDITTSGIGWDEYTGYGYLDVSRALGRVRAPYRVLRGSAQGGTATLTWDTHKHNFLGNGGLPGGVYWVKTYEVRNHIDYCGPTSEIALAWGRERDSRGWSAANANSELPYSRVENVTQSGFDAVTYVYWVQYDLNGGVNHRGWWPCEPAQALMAYTASTRSALSSVGIMGPSAGCAGTWRASTCGGEGDLGYAWYERAPGGAWSSVVATTPDYTRYLDGTDLELKLEVTSNGVALADTQYVTYEMCVVDVPTKELVRELRLTVSPNPARGRVSFGVEVPVENHVKLSIYDIGGRLIRRIVDARLPAGVHRFDWAPAAAGEGLVRSGLYFARLETAGSTRLSRVVLVE